MQKLLKKTRKLQRKKQDHYKQENKQKGTAE